MEQKITPNLWFNGNAKEAVDFYISVFPNSEIVATQYYPSSAEEGLADFQKEMAGKELVIEYKLNDQHFTAINAGPEFTFSEAISFAISCKDQEEIDYYWGRLSHVPEAEQCGWCKDQFGLSWQVVPVNMGELMQRPNAYAHMMQMKKLVVNDF
ncbi:MAG TPA: VOC family protein [Candidatus Chromulinivoraceae bacterium]|nr:VOC family protein [Candidatus Chromulinivoraceae bacterium]